MISVFLCCFQLTVAFRVL
jgi:WD40 repeat protein